MNSSLSSSILVGNACPQDLWNPSGSIPHGLGTSKFMKQADPHCPLLRPSANAPQPVLTSDVCFASPLSQHGHNGQWLWPTLFHECCHLLECCMLQTDRPALIASIIATPQASSMALGASKDAAIPGDLKSPLSRRLAGREPFQLLPRSLHTGLSSAIQAIVSRCKPAVTATLTCQS